NTIVPKPSQAPGAPGFPNPANGATAVGINPTLTWTASNAANYDVSFGTANPPPLVVSSGVSASYTPPALANNTTYFWQIVARNSAGSTPGSVWSFTTSAAPPATPNAPSPANGATGVAATVTLTWASNGAATYDVLFGPTDPPSQVASGLATASFTPAGLAANTTYFWQIVAHNSGGANQGPEWSFTTAPAPPPPPTAPSLPSPANGASAVSTTPTLTWSSTGAATYDVRFGTTNPPPTVSTAQSAASYAPAGLANNTTYYWQIVATNASGSATGPLWSFTTAAAQNVVIYASDVPAAGIHGAWTIASDATAANRTKLITPDNGWASSANALASPADYIEITFNAAANTLYAIWFRLQASNNSKYNDSIWVQFSDALANGTAVYPLDSTSALNVNLATDATASSLNGWGWQNGAYWLSQATTVSFARSGSHTMRIQVREDGVQLDQIVLSPSTYLSVAPGSATHDSTIVPKP